MDQLIRELADAHNSYNGYKASDLFRPIPPPEDPNRLHAIVRSTNHATAKKDINKALRRSDLSKISSDELSGWSEVILAYWKALSEIVPMMDPSEIRGKPPSWTRIYELWKDFTSQIIRGYNNYGFEAWCIPCLYIAGKHLRLYAIKSDEERAQNPVQEKGPSFADDFDPETEKYGQLRDCEQQLKRIFNLCLTDRAPLDESRKWGIYYAINLLFKTYFKLKSPSLSRTILKAINAYQGDMPQLSAFPKSQQVTFKYYAGVLSFLEENYVEAEEYLNEAWQLCHKDAMRNKERILTFLIPCHLLTTHTLPSRALLEPFPHLQSLFLPVCDCIRSGDLNAFDIALQENEDELIRRRIFLTLERGRDIALRNLFRKVFIAGGFEEPKEPGAAPIRRTRVPVAEFQAAINLRSGGEIIDTDEVECLLANMIYKNLMKGYIARERGIVVLSKNGAFPGTGI